VVVILSEPSFELEMGMRARFTSVPSQKYLGAGGAGALGS